MKKLVLVLAVLACSLASVSAQPRAVGVRFGYNAELSYQHNLNNNFVQFDLGLQQWFYGFQASATYNWIFASPKWTPKGNWDWYAGVGAGLGFSWGRYDINPNYYRQTYFFVGLAAEVGLSYTFWFPLQLSVDIRPVIGPAFGDMYNSRRGYYNAGIYTAGLFDLALGVRYSF